ncbi:proline-rich domain-containing protein [Streptomyces sp. NPDC096176]|uniref:proline-rich domain-containing protein n=1 Tax=Streptomyces sp. NPDC096176 TaxID=3366079 RepID=UPI0037F5C2A2
MTLTRGARITGAALCVVLALITGAWIVRDVSASDGFVGLWRYWVSDPRHNWGRNPQVTTSLDGALLLVYGGVAVAALRSSVAAGALVATAVFTLAVRLPSLWVITASWIDLDSADTVRTRALLSTFAVLGLAVGLVITTAAGRRPPEAGHDAGPRASAHRRTPTRPTRAVARTAAVLLFAEAAVTAAWQIRFAYRFGSEVYLDSLVGGDLLAIRLLAPPSGWLATAVVVLGLTAGLGLLAGAAFARPLGAVLAVHLAVAGATGVDFAFRLRIIQKFGRAPLEYQLLCATWLFGLIAGLVLLAVLTRRGESGPADGGCPGAPQPPPVHGCPQPSSGYGCPGHPGSGSGPPATGSWSGPDGPDSPGSPQSGYGYPPPSAPDGGFGPPPPSSPPPNW